MNSQEWNRIPFASQMGNIGSEINRAIQWHEFGDKDKKENALWRALELIDLTIAQRKSGELLRLREVICDLFLGKNNYNISTASLREYFVQFALIANK